MRYATILMVLVLCSTFVDASQIKFQSQLTNLLSLKAKATDAVDSALDVLQDLNQANADSQTAADQLDAAQQAECVENIAQLQQIATDNKQVAEDATAHREFIDQEVKDTNDYLDWITNRVQSIHNKREQLEEQRCVSNAFFIRALKEHSEAISVIELLKKDLEPFTSASEASLSQVKSVSDKLKAYSHLFNTQAIKAFNQLTQSQDVDETNFDWNSSADDNSQDELQLQGGVDGSQERNTKFSLGDKLLDLLNTLKSHLEYSIEDLTKNEIQSAWDLVTWLHLSEQELDHLANEAARKSAYLEKLVIAHQSAKAHEDQSWQIHDASVVILNTYIAECENKHNWYLSETTRRNGENSILDEVIQIFIERVSTINNDIRGRANDYSDNQQFDNDNFGRETEPLVDRDLGIVAQNVDAESRSY